MWDCCAVATNEDNKIGLDFLGGLHGIAHLNKKKLYLNGSHVCTYFSKDKESHVSQIFRVKLPPSQAIPPNIPSQTYLLFWYKVFLKDSIVQPRQTRSGTNKAQTDKEGEAILFTLHQ